MNKNLKDQDIPDESKKKDTNNSKQEKTSPFTRRQILDMGWSIPVAFGLNALFPKMADGGARVDWADHNDTHTDNHTDHYDYSSRPGATKIYPPFKQSLMQDVTKIREQVEALQAKIKAAPEGQGLSGISTRKIEESLQALTAKIHGQARKNRASNFKQLSTDTSNSINILNKLKRNMRAKNKSASLEQLNQLNKLLGGVKADINSL